MTRNLLILSAITLIGCADSQRAVNDVDAGVDVDGAITMDDGSMSPDTGSDTDTGTQQSDTAVPDAGSRVDTGTSPGTDAGTDTGTPDSGSSVPDPSCLLTDTDTLTYRFDVTEFGTVYPHFDVDGRGNEDPTGSCGISDTPEGYDNGFGTAITAALGSVTTTTFDDYITDSVVSTVSYRVTLTHVRSGYAQNPVDPCVGIQIQIFGPNWLPVPPPTNPVGVGSLINGHLVGTFPEPVTFMFTRNTNTPFLFTMYSARIDAKFTYGLGYIIPEESFVGGHVFYRPTQTDSDLGRRYDNLVALDTNFTAVWGSSIRTRMLPHQDVFVYPDGSLGPCGTNYPPNGFALTFRFKM